MNKDQIDKEIIGEFEKEFRDYLHASIAYAEMQEPYQALSSEDEIKWLKNYLTQALQTVREHEASIWRERIISCEVRQLGKVRMFHPTKEAVEAKRQEISEALTQDHD